MTFLRYTVPATTEAEPTSNMAQSLPSAFEVASREDGGGGGAPTGAIVGGVVGGIGTPFLPFAVLRD